MNISRLILRNTRRHLLRSGLTAVGIAIALLAFCFIRTMVDAWYTGVNNSAKNRILTRNSVSLIFYLPISYLRSIEQTPGVEKVGYGNWFGGIYKDTKYRFAQFAIDENYLDIYPEYVVTPEERKAFNDDRKGTIIGSELAEKFGVKVGDTIQIQGTIFPGMWEFKVVAIYKGREENTVTRTLFFHWDYLNERNRAEINRAPDQVGYFVIQLAPGANPAVVSRAIDEKFANSYAESLTETETAFQQSFVSMSSTIIMAMNIISGVVIVIMLLVLANTMLMAARERYREFAILKSLGFTRNHLAILIGGESLAIALAGFGVLILMLIPIFAVSPKKILGDLVSFFPVFRLTPPTLLISLGATILVALIASAIPVVSIMRMKVTDGLRRIS